MQQTLQGRDALADWVDRHAEDYESVMGRLTDVRYVTLTGDVEKAADNLRKAYLFAVLSIQTNKDRHERAFTRLCSGDLTVEEACQETVYGHQKAGWAEEGLKETDFEALIMAVRSHLREGRVEKLLELHEDITGVGYRKWAFTLAMSGVWELACVDSNIGQYLDLGDFNSAADYVDAIDEIVDTVGTDMPPFLAQWVIYDYQRGEHARHMAFFREVHSFDGRN